MKSTFKAIFLVIIAALSLWVLNAAANKFFYYDEPFLQVLLFHNQEISFKVVAVSLLILGLLYF